MNKRKVKLCNTETIEKAILNNEKNEDSFTIIARGIAKKKSDKWIKEELRKKYPDSSDEVFQRLIDETREMNLKISERNGKLIFKEGD